MIRLILMTLMLKASPVSAAEMPDDVAAFVARRDRCDHYRGEPVDDPAREAAVTKALAETCRGTDAERARLLDRHARDADVQKRLRAYDPNIEGSAPHRH